MEGGQPDKVRPNDFNRINSDLTARARLMMVQVSLELSPAPQYLLSDCPRMSEAKVPAEASGQKPRLINHNVVGRMVLWGEFYYAALDIREYWQCLNAIEPALFDSHQYLFSAKRDMADPKDCTSFVAAQKDWGPDRAHMAPVLFEIFPPEGWKKREKPPAWVVGVHTLIAAKDPQGYNQYRMTPRVIIDMLEAKPLFHFPLDIMPVKVSRCIEPFRVLQIERQDKRIMRQDFVQRMVHPQLESNVEASAKSTHNRFRINGRISQWRARQRISDWRSLASSPFLKPAFWNDLTWEMKESNSSRGLADGKDRRHVGAEGKATRGSKNIIETGADRSPGPESNSELDFGDWDFDQIDRLIELEPQISLDL
ncbi:MAG: hypothetical protein Q9227_002934 [Pyrenula ochraceoflavens]